MKRLAIATGLVFLLTGGLADANDFDNPAKVFRFLRERPQCDSVRCLNKRINRLEFIVRDLFRDAFTCDAVSRTASDGDGYPVVVYTC